MARKKRSIDIQYPKGGDGMHFYHKKTGHPAKQVTHTRKTWTNKRYTHSPNRMKDNEEDEELSTNDDPIYMTKHEFTDTIYTRGRPYDMTQYNRSKLNKKKKR